MQVDSDRQEQSIFLSDVSFCARSPEASATLASFVKLQGAFPSLLSLWTF